MRNDAFLKLMKAIEDEIAIRTESHMGLVPPRPILPLERCGPYLSETDRRERTEAQVAFLLNRPLNPKLRMEVPNSLGFYKEPAYDLDVTIYKRDSIFSRLFKKREKAQPKQEHVSLFEVIENNRQ